MRRCPLARDELEQLYYAQKLSMQQIAQHFGCSVNKVVYWMQQYGFERRTWSEATYVYRNPDGDPFKICMPETSEEWKLFGVGIGLYMGEGARKTKWHVAIVNTNPGVHRTFIVFLERFCGVLRKNVKLDLNVFDDCDVELVKQWWVSQLGLSQEQFRSVCIRPSKRSGVYKNKSMYGTLTVMFSNAKLKKIIDEWCSEYYS